MEEAPQQQQPKDIEDIPEFNPTASQYDIKWNEKTDLSVTKVAEDSMAATIHHDFNRKTIENDVSQ